MSWRVTTLGACCEIVSGATPSTSEPRYWDGHIQWATPKDLSALDGKYIDRTSRRITQEGLDSCGTMELPPYAVLFSSRAPIGHVAINTVPMATNQGFKSFVPKTEEVDADFLYHWLRANRPLLESLGNGATFKEVSKAVVSRIEIALPPIHEQRRIAEILDRADAIRRKREEAVALAGELLRSGFLEMFGDSVTNPNGWDTVAIEDVAAAERNALAIGPFGSNLLSSDYTAYGHPVIFVRDLVSERFHWKSNVFISDAKFAELTAHHARPGDVLATKMGDPPGIACVMPGGFPTAVVTADVVKVSVDRRKVHPEYLAAAINSAWGRRQIASISAGVTRAKITLRDFRSIGVRLPPLAEQARFAAFSAGLEVSQRSLRRAKQESDTLFASLVHQAFRGTLIATPWTKGTDDSRA